MYCKACGSANDDHALYCWHDGAALPNSYIQPKFQFTSSKSEFCSNCGHKALQSDSYCGSCGSSRLAIVKQAAETANPFLSRESAEKSAYTGKWPALNLSLLKKALIPALISFAIMLVFTFVSYSSTQSFFNNLFQSGMNEVSLDRAVESLSAETNSNLPKPGSIFGYTDMVMLSHMLPPSYTLDVKMSGLLSSSDSGKAALYFNFLSLTYLLGPILALIAAGIIAGRRDKESGIKAKILTSLTGGAIYGIILSLFSLFSGFSYKVNFGRDGSMLDLNFDTAYPFFKAFFTGLLLGFIFILIGMLFSISYKRATGHLRGVLPYGEAIHQGFAAFIRGFGTITVITFLVMLSKAEEMKRFLLITNEPNVPAPVLESTNTLVSLLSTKLSAAVWSLVNLIPVNFANLSQYGSMGYSYSAITGLKASDYSASASVPYIEMMLNFQNISLFLKLLILVPAGLFLWAGWRLYQRGSFNLISLAVFSFVYSLFMLFLSFYAGGEITGSYQNYESGPMEQGNQLHLLAGPNSIWMFIISFIFSYAAAYAGGMLYKLKTKR